MHYSATGIFLQHLIGVINRYLENKTMAVLLCMCVASHDCQKLQFFICSVMLHLHPRLSLQDCKHGFSHCGKHYFYQPSGIGVSMRYGHFHTCYLFIGLGLCQCEHVVTPLVLRHARVKVMILS